MVVKFKKTHPDAVSPVYARAYDAGADITAISPGKYVQGYVEYRTGLSVEIPTGYVGLIFPRSSISKTDLSLCNSVGVIDSGFRGEITFRFRTSSTGSIIYKQGDKIGQLMIMPIPAITFVEVDSLQASERGEGAYGSSGR